MVKYRIVGLYHPTARSIREVETRLTADPSNQALHYALGLLYARENRRDQAIAHLQKALSLNIMDPLVLLELGRVYTMDGQYERALTVLPGLQSDPVLGTMARYHLAEAQIESGDLASARQNLTRVMETSPQTFPRAYFHLAGILSRENKTALSHYYLGVYYALIQDDRNAVRHLKRALNEGLEDPDIKKSAEERIKEVSDRQRAGLKQIILTGENRPPNQTCHDRICGNPAVWSLKSHTRSNRSNFMLKVPLPWVADRRAVE
jgi:beta-barrel assembly-enhancing protease